MTALSRRSRDEQWARDQAAHMRGSYKVTPETFLRSLDHLRAGWRPRGLMDLTTADYLVAVGEWTEADKAGITKRPAKPKEAPADG